MAKKNYYAVRRGKTPGIYRTWEECRAQVEGFSGALYQGFATEEEAAVFIGGEVREPNAGGKAEVKGSESELDAGTGKCEINRDSTEVEERTLPVPDLLPGQAIAYVDGSYNVNTGAYSAGVVFFYEGEQHNFCRKGEDEEMAQMRNVAGEILGACAAMEEAANRGVRELILVHDYQGISSWCTGEWKTNKEGTKAYKAYFDSLQDRLVIQFRKVKGHSGDAYNDLADELARCVIFDPA